MPEFNVVLEEVEAGASSAKKIARGAPFDAIFDLPAGRGAPAPGHNAYLRRDDDEGGEYAMTVAELVDSFNDELENAAASRARLQSLRRKIAWALHPDRSMDAIAAQNALARFNALIDDALSRAAQR